MESCGRQVGSINEVTSQRLQLGSKRDQKILEEGGGAGPSS